MGTLKNLHLSIADGFDFPRDDGSPRRWPFIGILCGGYSLKFDQMGKTDNKRTLDWLELQAECIANSHRQAIILAENKKRWTHAVKKGFTEQDRNAQIIDDTKDGSSSEYSCYEHVRRTCNTDCSV